MPVVLDTGHLGTAVELPGRNGLTIGLVNNMPDAAVEATERQFVDLIRAVTSHVAVRLKLFAIPEIPRAAAVRRDLSERYRDVGELWNARLDGLIVTGTEPREAALADEPYWPALRGLVSWARENTASTIWSCLAAHAAVLHADGIERQPRAEKLFGVFDYRAAAAHPLLAGAPRRLRVPHSRHNDLPAAALTSCGYRLLARSAATGVDTFAREERGSSLFVFFQGHPEYEADTLLREYRRDAGRFLRGEREHFSAAPRGYFNDEAAALADDFRARAICERGADLIGDFPMKALEAGLENTWRRSAIAIYRNWVEYLVSRKAERRAA
jgi:homoserine O-succinyltransferase